MTYSTSCVICRPKAPRSELQQGVSPAKSEHGLLLLQMTVGKDQKKQNGESLLPHTSDGESTSGADRASTANTDEDGARKPNTNSSRKKAIESRRRRQDAQAEKMEKYRRKSLGNRVAVGSVVTVKTDYRDISHPRGVPGIVFDVCKSNAGGIQVATEHGIIVPGKKSKKYFIPDDRYVVNSDDTTINPKLDVIRRSIMDGTFDAENQSRVTLQRAHSLLYGVLEGGRKKCTCKKKCGPRCSCVRGKTSCNSSCKCPGGDCGNPHL
jgi:hypothetical protein